MKYLIILTLLCIMSACSEREADIRNQTKYEKEGLTFTYPANWVVTEDIENEGGRFIFVESPGDAIVKIEIYPFDESFELKEFVELDIEGLAREIPGILAMEGGNEIKEIKTSINGIDFSGYKYDFNVSIVNIDVPHVSEFYSFSSPNKVAYLTNQVASEDLEKVNTGFQLVLSSFELN